MVFTFVDHSCVRLWKQISCCGCCCPWWQEAKLSSQSGWCNKFWSLPDIKDVCWRAWTTGGLPFIFCIKARARCCLASIDRKKSSELQQLRLLITTLDGSQINLGPNELTNQLATRISRLSPLQVSFFIIQLLLLKPLDFRNRVSELVKTLSPEHQLMKDFHTKHVEFHQKYPENFGPNDSSSDQVSYGIHLRIRIKSLGLMPPIMPLMTTFQGLLLQKFKFNTK